jgi:hypothetical protein
MNWKEKKTDKGVLKYRMPNVVEGFDLLGLLDLGKDDKNAFRIKAKFISNMGNLVDVSGCSYASYDDAINDRDVMIAPLSEIADEVFTDLIGAIGKKP